MRVLIATGIYPPDIGGPATHSADLLEEFSSRGHQVRVVTIGDVLRTEQLGPVMRFPRRWPWALRLAAVIWWLWRKRQDYDVIYATGLHPSAVAASKLAGRPVLVKIVGDPAWERSRRLDLVELDFEDFQKEPSRSLKVRAMRWLRDWSVSAATAVIAPSEYLARTVEGWVENRHVDVIANGVKFLALSERGIRDENPRLKTIFVGRLVAHKRVELLIDAVASTPGTELEIVGDGPAQAELEALSEDRKVRDRVFFLGRLSHKETLDRIAAADAFVTASSYEGLPHVAIEALVCGVPVVSPAVGGLTEVVEDQVNGLIVSEETAEGFERALSRLRDDPVLLERLSKEASANGSSWTFEKCADRLEAKLQALCRVKPRLIFLGKGAIPESLTPAYRRKLSIVTKYAATTIIGVGRPGLTHALEARLIRLPGSGSTLYGRIAYYVVGPLLAASLAGGRRSCAIVCQSPYEAIGTALLLRAIPRGLRPKLMIEVHGDWRTAATMYGSPKRRLIAPISNKAADWSLWQADKVRVVSNSMEGLVRNAGFKGPCEKFIAYADIQEFEEEAAPYPEMPSAAFIGVLERQKGVDVLLEAWKDVIQDIPEAQLVMAGTGNLLSDVRREVALAGPSAHITVEGQLPHSDVKALIDASSVIVLPSRSEGLGLVIVESFLRARPVVGTAVGGIPELISDHKNGLLVPPEDPERLAAALKELLLSPALGLAMGQQGRKDILIRRPRQEFESGIARVAAWATE